MVNMTRRPLNGGSLLHWAALFLVVFGLACIVWASLYFSLKGEAGSKAILEKLLIELLMKLIGGASSFNEMRTLKKLDQTLPTLLGYALFAVVWCI